MEETAYTAVDIPNPFSDAPVYHAERTGSTMVDAEQLIGGRGLPGLLPLGPLQSGTVVWADFQFAGTGRLPGRTWEADSGESCLFTLILHEDMLRFSPGLFPLLAGYALLRLLADEYFVDTALKWPNDLLADCGGRQKKISGTLCRKRGRWFLLGMGVNCNQPAFRGELRNTAVSIRMFSRKKIDIAAFLSSLLAACKEVFTGAAADGKDGPVQPALLEKCTSHLLFLHREVIIRKGRPPAETVFSATLEGLRPDGGLLYRRPGGGTETLYSGEISLE